MTNLEDILKSIATNVNGVADLVTGDEYTTWKTRVNDSYQEWAHTYEPQVLVKTFHTTMAQSGYSLALPSNFKEKFAGYPNIGGNLYEEFSATEATMATGKYVTWGGDKVNGYYLKLSAALTSNVSVAIPYHSFPSSLTTLTSVPIIPDPDFLVNRATEKTLLQRGQTEYIEFQTKADLLLQRLVATEVAQDIQRNKTIRDQVERNNFTIGED